MRLRYLVYALLALLVVAGFWLFEGDFDAADVDAKYSNAHSQFFTMADGSRVHYRDQGRRDGTPVVLIHGSNSSLHTWEPWVQVLGDRYRIITVDLPGHGLTGRTSADDYSSEAYVAVVRALTRHLNVWPFILGGNSMGGGVTWRYTLAHTEDVQAMILVDASGLPQWRDADSDDDANRDRPLVFSLLGQAWFQWVARYLDPAYLVEQGLKASHYDPEFVDQTLIDRYYELSMREGTRHATLKRFGQRREATEENLGRLTQPALVMWGKYDNVIPVSVGERFMAALPNAQLIVYDDVGHIPMEEVPQRSAEDVDAFIEASIAPQRGGQRETDRVPGGQQAAEQAEQRRPQ